MAKRHWLLLSLAVGLILGPGCYNPYTLGTAISGRVTYRGKPIADGMISFVADFALGGRSAMSRISDGWYSVSREEGPVPGIYSIEIVGLDSKPATAAGPASIRVTDEIPDRYNKSTELKIAITKRASLELMFDLE